MAGEGIASVREAGSARSCVALTLLLWLVVSLGAQAANPAYPLKISVNKRYFVDQNNVPFLYHGDTPWSLFKNLTKEEAEQYLENRRQKGFNAVIVNILDTEPYPNGGDVNFRDVRNRYGEGPFKPAGDFSSPNEKYFAHIDWVIEKAAEKGILVVLAPAYLGCCMDGWIERLQANGPTKCRDYGRYLGNRYKDFDNIMWMHGGDRLPGCATCEIREIALGIRDNDKRHFHTAHWAPEHSALDMYPNETWLDFNTTYTYKLVHAMLWRDYSRVPIAPFILVESHYENEHYGRTDPRDWPTTQWVRRQAYWAILCGAAGQSMGNNPIWFFGTGWQAAMDSPGSMSMVHLKALFTSRAWYSLVPDQDHTVVTAGHGDSRSLDYLTAARTEDGGTVIAYLPTRRTVTIDMSKISGEQAKAWWFDPRIGKATSVGEFATRGPKEFTPPADDDWVLVLDDASKELSIPGVPK